MVVHQLTTLPLHLLGVHLQLYVEQRQLAPRSIKTLDLGWHNPEPFPAWFASAEKSRLRTEEHFLLHVIKSRHMSFDGFVRVVVPADTISLHQPVANVKDPATVRCVRRLTMLDQHGRSFGVHRIWVNCNSRSLSVQI